MESSETRVLWNSLVLGRSTGMWCFLCDMLAFSIRTTHLTNFFFIFVSQNQAPEQFVRSAPLSHKADVFSLGNVLYFLLSGHEPFDHLNRIKAERQVRKGLPLPLDESIRNSSHPFDMAVKQAILMCHIRDPSQRPDAQKVAAFLEHALDEYQK